MANFLSIKQSMQFCVLLYTIDYISIRKRKINIKPVGFDTKRTDFLVILSFESIY
jgi:hypothetical protein